MTCVLTAVAALLTAVPLCEPGAAVQRALAALPPESRAATLAEVAGPARALREQFPEDVFAHERYQDVVTAHGVEGELKAMQAEYARLRAIHDGDVRFLYLWGRSALGRGTRRAIAAMKEVSKTDPDFAPAHRTLAEIYGSAAFADAAGEAAERSRFLATCPGGTLAPRPAPLPARSALFEHPPASASSEEVGRALQADEARLLRMRLFDWYADAEKEGAIREMKEEYWTGFTLTVRHYRRTGQKQKADALLVEMEQRLSRTRGELFGVGARAVLGLYADGGGREGVHAALERMRAVTGGSREVELAALERAFETR